MWRKLFLSVVVVAFSWPSLSAQRFDPQEGWIPLFNGKDLTGWKVRDPDRPNGWRVVDGVYINAPPSVDILTEQEFYDFELHVEFTVAEERSNSGVYLRDKYEIQILNSYGRRVGDNICGALYRRVAPTVNASRPAGQWQTFEITFVGRRLTVVHNGRKVLDNVDAGPMGTGRAGDRPDGPGPLRLQGDHGAVSFRNLWIRPLSATHISDEATGGSGRARVDWGRDAAE